MSEAGPGASAKAPVAHILTVLASAEKAPSKRDSILWDAIIKVLRTLDADALVLRVGTNPEPLGVFLQCIKWPREKKDRFIGEIARLAERQLHDRRPSEPFRDADGYEYIFVFPDDVIERLNTKAYTPDAQHPSGFFCFISGLRVADGAPRHGRKWGRIINWINGNYGVIAALYIDPVVAYCRAIEMAFLRRAIADSIFAPEISTAFWNMQDDPVPAELCLRPWDDDGNELARHWLTATLSLDLRRSTIVMEHAIDKKKHADWLVNLVIVLKDLTRKHRGVFDKFTGDGVLVHFPVYSFERTKEKHCRAQAQAACNCIACAWDMVHAVQFCIRYMLTNITLDNVKFGPAVGVAFDEALWSIDAAGKPIVVGRGVVHACRLSDGERDTVQLTNAAYRQVLQLVSAWQDVHEMPFVSKEYPPGSGFNKVLTIRPPGGLGSSLRELLELVERVFGYPCPPDNELRP